MPILRMIIHSLLHGWYIFRKLRKTGPFGEFQVSYHNGPPPAGANALKKSLFAHHIKQYHEASCSVATMVTVVNAVKCLAEENFSPISQMDILDAVTTGNWKKRMSDKGDNGRRGLPLSLLQEIAQSSLDVYNIRYSRVEMIRAIRNPSMSRPTIQTITERLERFETAGDCLMIAHFDQGGFVPTLNIPHISPVGGFDPESRMVTILDVDPEQKQPYSIPFEAFYKGLSSNYHYLFSPFGIRKRGVYLYSFNVEGGADEA